MCYVVLRVPALLARRCLCSTASAHSLEAQRCCTMAISALNRNFTRGRAKGHSPDILGFPAPRRGASGTRADANRCAPRP